MTAPAAARVASPMRVVVRHVRRWRLVVVVVLWASELGVRLRKPVASPACWTPDQLEFSKSAQMATLQGRRVPKTIDVVVVRCSSELCMSLRKPIALPA